MDESNLITLDILCFKYYKWLTSLSFSLALIYQFIAELIKFSVAAPVSVQFTTWWH